MAMLGATKMPIVKNVRSIFVSKVFLTHCVGGNEQLSIEGPASTFYPAAFWNLFDRSCYESENTTRGHFSFHNVHFELEQFISIVYNGKFSMWALDPLGYFSTCWASIFDLSRKFWAWTIWRAKNIFKNLDRNCEPNTSKDFLMTPVCVLLT